MNLGKLWQTKLKYVLIVVMGAIVIFPFAWGLRLAMEKTFSLSVSVLPEEPTLHNFISLFTNSDFPRWILNSLIFAGGVTFFNLLLDSMVAYVIARKHVKYSKYLLIFVIGMMMVPYQVRIVPLFIMLSKMNLLNTFVGLILPLAADALGIFILHQYIVSIPREYDEAAMVDGAGPWRIFFQIIIPQAKPGLLVVAVAIFVRTWNNFIFPLVMITSDSMKTLTLGLADFTYATLNTNWGMTMAGSLAGALPAIILFVVLNKYFMEGLVLTGGTKG